MIKGRLSGVGEESGPAGRAVTKENHGLLNDCPEAGEGTVSILAVPVLQQGVGGCLGRKRHEGDS